MSPGNDSFPTATKRRILVVDDEPDVRQSARMMLEFLGYEVTLAGSGEEALKLFEQERFAGVITDYAMPGMKGDQLSECVKRLQPHCPVVMITAYAEMLRSSGKELSGVLRVLPKPFLLEQLRSALKEMWPGDPPPA